MAVKRSLKIDKVFCKNGEPYDCVVWEKRDIVKKAKDGAVIFNQGKVEIPAHWSHRAGYMVASKYFRGNIGSPDREVSVKQLFDRVVDTIANAGVDLGYFDKKNAKIFANDLKWLMVNQRMAFNSPVYFNVGASQKPQGSACFILGVEDDLKSIAGLQYAETMLFSQGSGAGSNLSNLRGAGEPLSKGGWASGPISFMRGYDAWAGIIRSGGVQRRASKMQRLDDTHPDVWNGKNNGTDFITFKSHEEKKAWALIEAGYSGAFRGEAYESISGQNCNLSVGLSDEFMRAALDGKTWATKEVITGRVIKKFPAMDMLKAVSEAAWFCGDPGVQFDDRLNEWHTCPKGGKIRSSNPCGEFVFIDNSACNLASINLRAFMETPENIFYDEEFMAAVRITVIAQDILIEMSGYPSDKIAENSKRYRPLGLGFCSLGGMFMAMGIPYDSEVARIWASAISALMTGMAYYTSAEIAGVLDPFAEYNANKRFMTKILRKHRSALDDLNIIRQDKEVTRIVDKAQQVWTGLNTIGSKDGFRNAQVTLVAPTGTIAHMMDAATQGVEPQLSLLLEKELDSGGSLLIIDPEIPNALESLGYPESEREKIAKALSETGNAEKSGVLEKDLAVFDTAFPPVNGKRYISTYGHLQMLAAVQPFVSGAISKTVNVPKSATMDEVLQVFVTAWKLGLKSVTIYRSGSKKAQPIAGSDSKEDNKQAKKRELPEIRDSKTVKFSVVGVTGFFHLGFFNNGDLGEVFITAATEGSTVNGFLAALGRSVSAGLQRNVPVDVYVKQFQNMKFEPLGFTRSEYPELKKCWSVVDYLAKVLAMYSDRKFIPPSRKTEEFLVHDKRADITDKKEIGNEDFRPLYEICRLCGNLARKKGTCYECDHCGITGSCG